MSRQPWKGGKSSTRNDTPTTAKPGQQGKSSNEALQARKGIPQTWPGITVAEKGYFIIQVTWGGLGIPPKKHPKEDTPAEATNSKQEKKGDHQKRKNRVNQAP